MGKPHSKQATCLLLSSHMRQNLCQRPTTRLYLGVLEDRLGIEEGALPGVSERGLLTSFGKSLKQRSREVPCFGSGRMSSEEWWGEVVRATFIGAGIKENDLDGVFAEVFEELFHEVFTGEAAWELVPVSKWTGGRLTK